MLISPRILPMSNTNCQACLLKLYCNAKLFHCSMRGRSICLANQRSQPLLQEARTLFFPLPVPTCWFLVYSGRNTPFSTLLIPTSCLLPVPSCILQRTSPLPSKLPNNKFALVPSIPSLSNNKIPLIAPQDPLPFSNPNCQEVGSSSIPSFCFAQSQARYLH
jgi:hypothetical protein